MDKGTSFAITNFVTNFKQLNSIQKKIILKYIAGLIILLLIVTGILGHKLHKIKNYQEDFIVYKTGYPTYDTKEFKAKLKNEVEIKTKVYMWNMSDINMKDKYLNLNFFAEFSYVESEMKNEAPQVNIFNGRLISEQLLSHNVKNGIVHDYVKINADVEPQYMVQLYPLDKELISVRLVPKDQQKNYYYRIVGFYDYTEGAQSNYNLVGTGFVNQVMDTSELALLLDAKPYYGMSRAFMLFEHKSIYSFIKSIQYILLSVCIAILALLVNAKTNSPKNGRVAVIGSSVFALAANVFQLNSSSKPIIGITVIDLMTFFCSIVIILCFLITLRALRFLDDDGYAMGKIFDQALFICIFICSAGFFTAIYVYA